MNLQEFHQLQAERAALKKMLDQLPATSVIDRMSLEDRKKEVEEALASQPEPSREPVRAKLTFRGKPIVGSHGMFAEFGAAVVNSFAEAVAAIGASQTGPLGTRGAIPKRDDYRLLITGTALGSFGFELEEAPKDNMMLFPELSPVESAIEQAKAIMEASLGTDDDLTEAISDAGPRALDELRTFLKTMADQEAVCTLEFKDEVFRFADVGQVRRSEQRLSQDNIHEEDVEIAGVFQGVLPKRRTFEFRVSETDDVISGKVGPDIEEARQINHILEKPLIIKVRTRRAGTGRPRYVLLSYELSCEETSTQGEQGSGHVE
ncbi:MAG: hypothetical protein KAY37_02855 [Phycisphaerae bacterium]|nr:hypothetical protein [Phycisphaerae bacterium]